MEFGRLSSFKSLGDIGHDRNGSSANLVTQSKITRKGSFASYLIDVPRQDRGFLPRYQVLKPFDLLAHRTPPSSNSTLSTQYSALITSCKATLLLPAIPCSCAPVRAKALRPGSLSTPRRRRVPFDSVPASAV